MVNVPHWVAPTAEKPTPGGRPPLSQLVCALDEGADLGSEQLLELRRVLLMTDRSTPE